MSDLFISYSRKNKEFVTQLHAELIKQRIKPEEEMDIWLDVEDIEWAADWWQRIEKGIEETNNFGVIISANYLASDVCNAELKAARAYNKRIIPIVVERVNEEDRLAKLEARTWKRGEKDLSHEQWKYLRRLNWINFEKMSFEDGVAAIMAALRENVAHKDYHTELNERALQWERSNHERSYLLT
ncbi:MAG: toll/interleukin-1 receptor domain-containing protein, partial [Chloroflexota bacterium]